MGRNDPGLAVYVDWAARKREVLEQAQAGWPALAGNQVYLDLTIDGRTEQTMRLVFGLFLEQAGRARPVVHRSAVSFEWRVLRAPQVPLASANFYHLCKHTYDGLGEAGHPLTYRRSRFHRLVRGKFMQGGDITLRDGTGGDSIYGAAGEA